MLLWATNFSKDEILMEVSRFHTRGFSLRVLTAGGPLEKEDRKLTAY